MQNIRASGCTRRTAQSLTAFKPSTASHVKSGFLASQFLTDLAEKEQLGNNNVGPGNWSLHGVGERVKRKEAE